VIVAGHPPLLGEWEELERHYPEPQRLLAAITAARDLDACIDLLAGRPVNPARLDPSELAKLKRASLVRLVPPFEMLEAAEAA
jgi:hypothetical protein